MSFVYVNLTGRDAVVNGPFGGAFTIPNNKAVKGEYFARFAQPKGPLTMFDEDKIRKELVLFTVKPLNEDVSKAWAETKAKVNPIQPANVPDKIAAVEEASKDETLPQPPKRGRGRPPKTEA